MPTTTEPRDLGLECPTCDKPALDGTWEKDWREGFSLTLDPCGDTIYGDQAMKFVREARRRSRAR